MEKNVILSYEEVKNVKEGISKESMVDVRRYDDTIIAQYEKYDMVAYTGTDILVREAVAEKLAAVNMQLTKKYRLKLKIVYGYRAPEVQSAYFKKKQDELRQVYPELASDELLSLTHNFVAVPDVAGHATGGAVDVTLVKFDGTACDVGTRIADFSDEGRIKTFAAGLTINQRRYRQILLDEMVAAGFAPFLGEWWHFSFGDREWAAYYEKSVALYGPVSKPKTATTLEIAGGNQTVLQTWSAERANPQAGKLLLDLYSKAEQVGFVDIENKRLEMAGGEFCGNASAAAAVLLAIGSSLSTVDYAVSGFENGVTATVAQLADDRYKVRTSFRGMNCTIDSSTYEGRQVKIVDMKGIIHVLIDDEFPASNYEALHRAIVQALNLGSREAVGVIWCKRKSEKVYINPVVWVKDIDTLYYESACGSGSIAAALGTDCHDVIQPTGQSIRVYVNDASITTECKVAIIT